MEVISFDGNIFKPNDINGRIECPINIRTKMANAARSASPLKSTVNEYMNSACVSFNNKSVVVNVWQFELKDFNNRSLLEHFFEDGADKAIVWGIEFYEDGNLVSASDNANTKCVIGYKSNEEAKALFMAGTKAMMFVRSMSSDIAMFFADKDELIDLVAEHLPANSNVSKTKISIIATVPVKDYDVKVTYSKGVLNAVIPHKYTMTDEMYGARYLNYSRTINMQTSKEITSFNWDALWDDLYNHRNGECTYRGSLGS